MSDWSPVFFLAGFVIGMLAVLIPTWLGSRKVVLKLEKDPYPDSD